MNTAKASFLIIYLIFSIACIGTAFSQFWIAHKDLATLEKSLIKPTPLIDSNLEIIPAQADSDLQN